MNPSYRLKYLLPIILKPAPLTIMTKISLDIDEKVLALVQEHARETGTTVEGLIVEHLQAIAWENSPERAELAAQARKELVRLSEDRRRAWPWVDMESRRYVRRSPVRQGCHFARSGAGIGAPSP